MENLENIELINRAKEGDSTAFETLVNQNYMFVYKISYRWIGVKEDAEDITQDVFVKLAGNIKTFKAAAAFQTWLYRVTINTAKDFTRKNEKIRQNETTSIDEVQVKYDENDDEISLSEKLHKLIGRLPTKLKETAILVFSEGLNHKEAATILDCAEKTISWRVFQIKKILREFFGEKEVL